MTPQPPYFARMLLALVPPARLRQVVLGDVEEAFEERVRRQGARWARLWFFFEACRLAASFVLARLYLPLGGARTGSRASWRTARRHVLVRLRLRPARTLAIALLVSLGTTTGIAAWTIVRNVRSAAAAFPEADRVVRITSTRAGQPGSLSLAEIEDLRGLAVFESVAAYLPDRTYTLPGMPLVGGPSTPGTASEAVRVNATVTSRELFHVLGSPLLTGQVWPASYDRTRSFGVLLGERLWRARFGADPAIAGREIILSGGRYTVFGVVPDAQGFPATVDVYRSAGVYPNFTDRGQRDFFALARLGSGTEFGAARAAIASLDGSLALTQPETNRDIAFAVAPLHAVMAGPLRGPATSAAVLGVMASLVCIATGLLVSTAWPLVSAKGRWWEAVMLGTPAALVGAWCAQPAFTVLLGEPVRSHASWLTVAPGGVVIVGGWVAAVATLLTLGWLGARLRSAAHAIARPRSRLQSRGAVLRVAVSLTCLAGGTAGAVALSAAALHLNVVRLYETDHGLEDAGIATFRLDLTYATYRGHPDRARRVVQELLTQLARTPGIAGVGTNLVLPFSSYEDPLQVLVSAQRYSSAPPVPYVSLQQIGGDYLQVMGIPLLRGRAFTAQDTAASAPVALVGRRLALAVWGHLEILGERLMIAPAAEEHASFTVVGVTGDVRQHPLTTSSDFDLYTAFPQAPELEATVVVKTAMAAREVGVVARRILGTLDPDQAVSDELPMSMHVDRHRARYVIAARFATALAILGGLLAAVAAGTTTTIHRLAGKGASDCAGTIAWRAARNAVLLGVLCLIWLHPILVAIGAPAWLVPSPGTPPQTRFAVHDTERNTP